MKFSSYQQCLGGSRNLPDGDVLIIFQLNKLTTVEDVKTKAAENKHGTPYFCYMFGGKTLTKSTGRKSPPTADTNVKDSSYCAKR